jgi:hypothetical protein
MHSKLARTVMKVSECDENTVQPSHTLGGQVQRGGRAAAEGGGRRPGEGSTTCFQRVIRALR